MHSCFTFIRDDGIDKVGGDYQPRMTRSRRFLNDGVRRVVVYQLSVTILTFKTFHIFTCFKKGFCYYVKCTQVVIFIHNCAIDSSRTHLH